MLILILLYIFNSDQCPWSIRVLSIYRWLGDRLNRLRCELRLGDELSLGALEPISEIN